MTYWRDPSDTPLFRTELRFSAGRRSFRPHRFFAFPKPGDPSKSIIIMNAHPSSTFNPPEPTTDEPFAPEGLYELRVDTNGDMIADIAYRMRFSRSGNGGMTATVRRAEGPEVAGRGEEGKNDLRQSAGLNGRGSAGDELRRLSPICGMAQAIRSSSTSWVF